MTDAGQASSADLLARYSHRQGGQVLKDKHVVDVTRRMRQGCLNSAQTLLTKSHGGPKLNTTFIKRLNATFRFHLVLLAGIVQR